MTEQDLSLVRVLYFGLFIGVFAFFLQWESAAAKRPFADPHSRRRHVLRNLGMLALVVVIADLVVGEWLLRAYAFLYQPPVIWLDAMALPLPAQIVLGFLASDLLEYGLHVASHRIGWFWRLHAVHHTDAHIDVTTAGRSHPLDVSIYVAAKIGLYALLGLPLWIEGVRALFHNTFLCVQHANVNYPGAVERLRWLLVTPAMHRVHHDQALPNIDCNYGFIFSFWDRLFGTYRTPGRDDPERLGLAGCEGEAWQDIRGMLVTPIRDVRHPRDRRAGAAD
jgi:sterol desaturase/sphingolipid hydroxylase (fatty acid hydroxylase superfamily)